MAPGPQRTQKTPPSSVPGPEDRRRFAEVTSKGPARPASPAHLPVRPHGAFLQLREQMTTNLLPYNTHPSSQSFGGRHRSPKTKVILEVTLGDPSSAHPACQ